jgi:hypothetical protein
MSSKHGSNATEHFNKLIQFRQAAYEQLGNACDAMFELTDAVIQMRQIQSFAELSCAPAFRRKWPSAYEALQDGCPNREGLLGLYLEQLPTSERLLLVGDHTAWPRLSADTLADRSYQYQSTPIPGRMPVTIGHGYSTIAVIPQDWDKGVLPVLNERITAQKPLQKAADQLRLVCQQVEVRPLSLWDSGYSHAAFLLATQDVQADKLLRLRSNLCLEGPTKPRRSNRGPVPKHGIKFKFDDPSTWWEPDQVVEEDDPRFGALKIRIWKGLRFRKALDCHMLVAQVEHLELSGSRRKPKVIWFAWIGEDPPEGWWQLYRQRYRIEHCRFAEDAYTGLGSVPTAMPVLGDLMYPLNFYSPGNSGRTTRCRGKGQPDLSLGRIARSCKNRSGGTCSLHREIPRLADWIPAFEARTS